MNNRHSMIYDSNGGLPPCFIKLCDHGCLELTDMHRTADGFFAVSRSLSDILAAKGINTFPDFDGAEQSCSSFFDDWYLYALPDADGWVYSLFKMREQEHDHKHGIHADGDTPGVTVSFISFDTAILENCLTLPSYENRSRLNIEINRTVAFPGQRHHASIKNYFNTVKAAAPYLIAELYTRHIASFAENGCIAVPEQYSEIFTRSKMPRSRRKDIRLPKFIEENNSAAGYIVCDNINIYIRDPNYLSTHEKLAILATHTANTSFNSFAAEIHYHARFLVWYAKVPLPFLNRSVYASAVRADLTIADSEFEGPAPFYSSSSKWVRKQIEYHGQC